MTFIVILIILAIIWLMFGPRIQRWLAQFAANRTEDYIRKATGMPPRPGSREARRQEREQQKNAGASSGGSSNYYRSSASGYSRRRRSGASRRNPNEPLIPKEYAVDVEYVETISYSQDTTIGVATDGRKRTVYHESQVSDVEWEEIRIKPKR